MNALAPLAGCFDFTLEVSKGQHFPIVRLRAGAGIARCVEDLRAVTPFLPLAGTVAALGVIFAAFRRLRFLRLRR